MKVKPENTNAQRLSQAKKKIAGMTAFDLSRVTDSTAYARKRHLAGLPISGVQEADDLMLFSAAYAELDR